MSEVETSWSEAELTGIDFGDERLNKRVVKLTAQLSQQPQAFINQACQDWADTKAAYRFFDNEKVKSSQIIAAHRNSVIERMKKHDLVLAIQDTCEIDYSAHRQKKGMGQIGNEKGQGVLMHTSLAVTKEGVPLGILAQQIWARKKRDKGSRDYRNNAITDKESYRWLKTLEQTLANLPQQVQVVTVGDREVNIFEFLLRAEQLSADYLIRARQDRSLMTNDKGLWAYLATQPLAGEFKVEVAAKKNEPARTAKMSVRYAQVEIKPPNRVKKAKMAGWKPVTLWAVYVTEVDVPQGVTALEWMLLTNVAVNDWAAACERIQWYCQRWQIELWHKVLKSGCRVEACLLEKAERIERYLTLMSVVAWRLFWLSHINRIDGQASCTTILAPAEWQALFCTMNKTTQLPQQPPTVGQVVHWIARLGGFLGRKNDGEPGITVIWRGWQRLTDIVATWLIFHPQTCG